MPDQDRSTALAAFLLRIALGTMFIAHSLILKLFVFTPAGTAQFFGSLGLPSFLAYLTIAAEIVRVTGSTKAYLTFDIDCLDPSVAPGTGTPVPGGLSYHQAASIIRKLVAVNFVAMDLVEVSPPYDHAEITALAGACLAMEYLCLRAFQRGARATPMPE